MFVRAVIFSAVFCIYFLSGARGEERCVPLPDCEPLLSLFNNRNDIPGMSKVSKYKHIQ